MTRLIRDLDRAEAEAEAERQRLAAQLAGARHEIHALQTQLAAAVGPLRRGDDPELDLVESELRRLDPDRRRFAAALRRAFDVVYDGRRTGRFSPDQLSKVEKSLLPTVVEHELRRELGLGVGSRLDFRIGGIDVDCKFSQRGSGWLVPAEAVSQLCLLVSADDIRSVFSVGLLRIAPDSLHPSRNGDGKRAISGVGRASIRFLVRDGALPENVLLHTDDDDVAAIFAERTGGARVLELFRRVRNRKVDRATLCAVAMQEQAMRRARDAREKLPAEGVLVLGHTAAWVCAALGLPEPSHSEFVSVRLARRRRHHGDAPTVELDGKSWVVATPEDPVEPGPAIELG